MICEIAKRKLVIKEKELEETAERRKCISFNICPECGGELEHHRMFGNILINKCISCSELFNYCIRG